MKIFAWSIAFIMSMTGIILYTSNFSLKKEIAYQDLEIDYLESKIEDLETKQRNIDWFESELDAIDNYIKAIDVLKISSNSNFPELKRTAEELNEARYEVVKNAIYWDRELNKREEEK